MQRESVVDAESADAVLVADNKEIKQVCEFYESVW